MTDEDKPMKALYDHCIEIFEEMEREAVPETETQVDDREEGDEAQVGTGYLIWTGHTTHLFSRLGKATPYYTSVMDALKKMGCVEQLKRGGGNSMSKWRLVRKPEEDFFHEAEKRKSPTQGSQKALEQQVRGLNIRVQKLEDVLTDLIQNLPPVENVMADNGTSSGFFSGTE